VAERYDVLFVCTGNVCRSPMAEYLFAHRLRERLGDQAEEFHVSSAGTGALAGDPMTAHSATVLGELGVVPTTTEAFRGRQLAAELVDPADLVLTATREHRMLVAQLLPEAAPKTFTIAEFALLAAAVDPDPLSGDGPADRARELAEAALDLRGIVQPGTPKDLDVADPYMREFDVYRRTGKQLDEALTVIADAIAAPASRPAP
jgi:protein-tyrosine phosphatase